jgi:hypothetical protein
MMILLGRLVTEQRTAGKQRDAYMDGNGVNINTQRLPRQFWACIR